MSSTPEMVDSVNVLILTDRRVTIEDISEQLEISLGTVTKKNCERWLCFFKVSCCWVSIGQCKASYCSKNCGSHQSVWVGMAVTSSLQYRSDPFKTFFMKQSFQAMIQ